MRTVKRVTLVLWTFAGLMFPAVCAAQIPSELPCTGGSSDMESPTYNGTTQKTRSWLCVDATGHVSSPVFGSAGSGVTSFNTRTGAVVSASGDYTVGQVTGAAPLASPALTGVPTAPTAVGGTNTTQLATTAFVQAALPAVPVTSVFGRTGAVVAVTTDYGTVGITGPSASSLFFDSGGTNFSLTEGASGAFVNGSSIGPQLALGDSSGETLTLQATSPQINLRDANGDTFEVSETNTSSCIAIGIGCTLSANTLTISAKNITLSSSTGNLSWTSTNDSLTVGGALTVTSCTGCTGGGTAFSTLTGSTNTTAAMIVGTGASLNVSGSGTINATTLGNATFASPGAIGGTTPSTSTFTTETLGNVGGSSGSLTFLGSSSGTINIACTGATCLSLTIGGVNGLINGGPITALKFNTGTNCVTGASCGSAASGFADIAAAATTVTISTTAVTANSQIKLQFDATIGGASQLNVTCNTGTSTAATYWVSTRTPGTSFVVSTSVAPVTNPACFSWSIGN